MARSWGCPASGTVCGADSDSSTEVILCHLSITKRRHRTSPRALKRFRHNHYRVKKRNEASSIRHNGPATIRIHSIEPRAA